MTIDIVPSIVPQDPARAIEQISRVRGFAQVFQLDIGDGVFTPRATLQSKDIPQSVLLGHQYEVHLMVAKPDAFVHEWLRRGPQRIILHAESNPSAFLIQEIEHEGIEPVIGLLAHTDLARLDPYVHLVQSFLFLSIDPPGGQGEKFIPAVVKKMQAFHQAHPSYTIEGDGGINESTMHEIIRSGATRLVMGSAIFNGIRAADEQYNYFMELARQYAQEGDI